MKKYLALLLVMLMVVSQIGFATAEEPLGLKVLGRQRSGITFEEVQTVHAWEVLMDMFRQNNLVPEFTVIERDQYQSVLNATLASGDLPDFFYAASLSDADRVNLIEQGLVMNIDDALQYSSGPAAKEFAEEGLYYISRQMNTYTDGGMYYFGNVSKQISVENETFGPHAIIGNNSSMLIRQDWLDKLGLPMPTTTDELLDTLIAFKENDMNGNGVEDERICIDVDSFFNGVAQWFGLAPFYFQMNRATGQAEVPFLQEGYPAYVRFLQKCVENEVLFLSDVVSYYNGGTSEGDDLGIAMQDDCVAAYYGVALADHALQPEQAVYSYLPTLRGTEGLEPVMNASVGYKVWSSWAFTTKADPKSVAAFLDTICTQEYAKWVTFGILDETYKIVPESGEYKFTASNVVADILQTKVARGYPLVIDSFLPDASQIGWYQEYYGPLNWASYSDFLDSKYFDDSIKSSYSENQVKNLIAYCKDAENVLLYNFNQDIGMTTPMITPDESEIIDFYMTDLITYMDELTPGFLINTFTLDEFETYLEEMNGLGLQEVLGVRQAQYNRYLGK